LSEPSEEKRLALPGLDLTCEKLMARRRFGIFGRQADDGGDPTVVAASPPAADPLDFTVPAGGAAELAAPPPRHAEEWIVDAAPQVAGFSAEPRGLETWLPAAANGASADGDEGSDPPPAPAARDADPEPPAEGRGERDAEIRALERDLEDVTRQAALAQGALERRLREAEARAARAERERAEGDARLAEIERQAVAAAERLTVAEQQLERSLETTRSELAAERRLREEAEAQAARAEQRAADLAAEVRDERSRRLGDVEGAVGALGERAARAEQLARDQQARDANAGPHPTQGPTVSLSSASFGELRALGMSVTQAKRVMRRREARGGFTSVDELDEVPGFPRIFLAEVKGRLVP
jgi:DNA uptake protein ComE-like DNA-binding protein